jgi:hypothetical protein
MISYSERGEGIESKEHDYKNEQGKRNMKKREKYEQLLL